MKPVLSALTLPLFLVLLAAPRAGHAQEAGIFADPAGTQTQLQLPAFVPTDFHVLGFDLAGQVKGWELSVILDPSFIVLERDLGGELWIDVGGPTDNFIVGTGACLDGTGVFEFVRYRIGWFAGSTPPADQVVCLGPASPSSFVPASPGYLQCDNTLTPMDVVGGGGLYPEGCMVINPTSFCGPLDVITDFGLSSQVGSVGDLVGMPLMVGKSGYIDCPADPFPIRRMHLEFSWDQSIAALESVTPGSVFPADWTIQFALQGDRAVLDLEGPSDYQPASFGQFEDFLDLGFRMSTVGATPVIWQVTEVFDASGDSGPAYPFADGSLESQTVPNETKSFGQLKAGFGQ